MQDPEVVDPLSRRREALARASLFLTLPRQAALTLIGRAMKARQGDVVAELAISRSNISRSLAGLKRHQHDAVGPQHSSRFTKRGSHIGIGHVDD